MSKDDRFDIVQDARLRFFAQIDKAQPHTCNRYLIRMLKTNYIDYTRRLKRQLYRETLLETHEFHLRKPHTDWIDTVILETDVAATLNPKEHALYKAIQSGYSLRECAHHARITLAHTIRAKLQLYWEDTPHDE